MYSEPTVELKNMPPPYGYQPTVELKNMLPRYGYQPCLLNHYDYYGMFPRNR